jgi:hypothetical protein
MLAITDALAQRLEQAEAADGATCVEAEWLLRPHSDAALKSVAGAYVMYAGPLSPLTHVLGLGIYGPVTASDLDEIEEFYRERSAPIIIDLCPHAHASVRELVSSRGYTVSEFTNVMVRDLTEEVSTFAPVGLGVRCAEPLDLEVYSETLARGFFGRELISEEERHLGRVIFSMPSGRPYLVDMQGSPVGCGSVSMRRGVASFYGDATLVPFRTRGVQTAVIAARLRTARETGCDVASAGTQPGSVSQRNYQRLGFQVAYTKAVVVHD